MNGTDLDLDRYMNRGGHTGGRVQGHYEVGEEGGMNGTLETSGRSKHSRVSEEQSADTYNFKSTEDDEIYSTIRSDLNNTANLTDTQALKTYQASINEQEELEEGEIDVRPSRTVQVQPQTRGNVDKSDKVQVRETEDEEEDEDEYDDDYEDEGDDEEDDGQQSEKSATYRTDDDDF